MASDRPRDRRRVNVTVDKDLWPEIIALPGREEKSRYFNEAARRFRAAPYRLTVPDTRQEVPVGPFLEEAYQDLLLTGVSLHRRMERDLELLTAKVEERVSLRIMTINPHTEKGDLLHLGLQEQLGAPSLVEDLLAHTRTAVGAFLDLRRVGLSKGVSVQVRGCNEVPMCGAIVRDHGMAGGRMRVNLYTGLAINRPHPHLEVDPGHEEGRSTYDSFYEYVQGLWVRATDLAG